MWKAVPMVESRDRSTSERRRPAGSLPGFSAVGLPLPGLGRAAEKEMGFLLDVEDELLLHLLHPQEQPRPAEAPVRGGELSEIAVDSLEQLVGPQEAHDQEGLLLLAPAREVGLHAYARWPFIIRLCPRSRAILPVRMDSSTW